MKTCKVSLFLVILLATLSGSALAAGGQPHMRNALQHLRAARAELQTAEHNKGGWRDRAIEPVNRAIADTERGMAAAR